MTTTSTTSTEAITWKMLRGGDWGVCGPSSAVHVGATVAVTRASGSTSYVHVDRVLWEGDGKAIARVTRVARPTTARMEARTAPASPAATVATVALASSLVDAARHVDTSTDAGREAAQAAIDAARAVSPVAIVDTSNTYRGALPSWEPMIGACVLADNGQDLTRTIGAVTIRKSDDARAIAIAGSDYTPDTHSAVASVCDAITAPYGGANACTARVHVSPDLCTLYVWITLPLALSQLLSVAGDERRVKLVLRTSHDGSARRSVSLYVERSASNAGCLVRGGLLRGAHKHTSGIVAHDEQIKAYADALPGVIAKHAEHLRALATRTLSRSDLVDACKAIMYVEESDAPDAPSRLNAGKLFDRVVAADGGAVPASTSTDADKPYTALQVFEAACTWHHSDQIRHSTGADPIGREWATLYTRNDNAGDRAWSYFYPRDTAHSA